MRTLFPTITIVGDQEEVRNVVGARKGRSSDASSFATLTNGDPRVQELQMQVASLSELVIQCRNQSQIVCSHHDADAPGTYLTKILDIRLYEVVLSWRSGVL